MSAPILAIVVHGGAWSIPAAEREAHRTGCLAAAELGFGCLEQGGSALDAVVVAVRALEDDPTFDAGTGSVLAADGEVQLDAGLMDGRSLKIGAVANVRRVRSPVVLARAVLEHSAHHFLVGAGAEAFARARGLEEVDPARFVVERERSRHAEFLAGRLAAGEEFQGHDTVGAVALDAMGQVAAGNSTGGVAFSLPGRVGDAPLPGVGYVADSRHGGVACTGWGEHILRVTLASRALHALERGASAADAAREAVAALARVSGRAGLIVLDRAGEIGLAHTTECLAHAFRTSRMPRAQGATAIG